MSAPPASSPSPAPAPLAAPDPATQPTAPVLLPTRTFYRRPLPPSCIAFASTRGKDLFAKALAEGNMEGYFLLAGVLEMQADPAFCGLGTLCTILNALEVDPQRKWRGAWRWYDQSMLDCCRPLTDVASVGLTLSEFTCLAQCNGLRARRVSPLLDSPSLPSSSPTPSSSSSDPAREEGLAKFRGDLRHVAKGNGAMAYSYSRKTLGQTGDGHFSPIGGYCEGEDMVLILDVARFKYPSYWVPVPLAYDAMFPVDKATGQPRGYVMLEVGQGHEPGSLSAPLSLTSLTLNKSSWSTLSQSLSKLLLSSSRSSPSASSLLNTLLAHLSTLATPALSARPSSPPTSLPSDLPPQPATNAALDALLDALAGTELAKLSDYGAHPDPKQTLLNLLLLCALFSPRSALTTLLPPSAAPELLALLSAATSSPSPSTSAEAGPGAGEGAEAGGVSLQAETDFLTKQLGALGECCRSEEDGAGAVSCGCAIKQGRVVELPAVGAD
ncbi:hypothetical protein JCM8097_001112 [Rhodosporidiobolus ruineniae]